MKFFLFALIAILFAVRAIAQTPLDLIKSNYHIIFEDDFNYSTVSVSGTTGLLACVATSGTPNVIGHLFSDNWTLDNVNGGDSYYLPDNVTQPVLGDIRFTENLLPDSVLIGGHYYHHSSGGLISNLAFSYGIFEASIKFSSCTDIDMSSYTCPATAFWTNPGGGLDRTEIDILDNSQKYFLTHAVWDWQYSPNAFSNYLANSVPFPLSLTSYDTNFSDTFHDFACVWTPSNVTFYVDGVPAGDTNYTFIRTYGNYYSIQTALLTYWLNNDTFSAGGYSMDIASVKIWEQNCTADYLALIADGICPEMYYPYLTPELIKYENILIGTSLSSTSLGPIMTRSNQATILESEGTTILPNFIADESTLTTRMITLSTDTSIHTPYITNGFFEILPIICGQDSSAWYLPRKISNDSIGKKTNIVAFPANYVSDSIIIKSPDTTKYNTINKVAVDSMTFTSQLSISPNPTNRNVNITFPCNSTGQLEILIKDVDGRVRFMETVSCNQGGNVMQGIDISSFEPGVYFIDLTLNDQHVVKKLVKI